MITKFEKYNESIKHLLVGPTIEEVWKNIGYDRTFGTPEEFLEYILDNLVVDNKYLDSVYFRYKPTNEIYFEYQYKGGIFYYSVERIYNVLDNIFNVDNPTEKIRLLKNNLIYKLKLNPIFTLNKLNTFWESIK